MRWGTLAKLAWDSMKEPDPKSPGERAKKWWRRWEEFGDAAGLVNEVLKLTDEEGDEESCSGK